MNKKKNFEIIKEQNNTPNPLFEFRINEPKQKQNYNFNEDNMLPYIFGQNPYFPTQINNPNPFNYPHGHPMYSPMLNYPYIIKKNYINLNPVTDFNEAAEIYEDILPNNLTISMSSFSTLAERNNIADYIRNIFIKISDGEEILMSKLDNGIKSNHNLKNLMSHIKLLEINPYHYNRINITDNPYKTMPFNFCMYRSCYPIKMNEFNNIDCAKSNIGINVRIYGLTINDLNHYNNNEWFKSDMWRELEYYKLIKTEISNVMPNFIQYHAYFRAKNIGINFKQFALLRNHIEYNNYEKNNQIDLINILYGNDESVIKQTLLDKGLITHIDMTKNLNTLYTELYNKNTLQHLMLPDNNNNILDDNIIILSEAPTQNIINWASKTYISNGLPIKKMIQSGYHSYNEWESVLFQLLASFIIMFDKKLVFRDFSLESNVFIKDLQFSTGTNIGYWKYIINNIEYHVPNYGSLVLIDSSYKDIFEPKIGDYKIHCLDFFYSDNELKNIIELTLKNMLYIFNSNIFVKYFSFLNTPTNKVKKLLENLNKEIKEINNIYVLNKDVPLKQANVLYSDIRDLIYELPLKIIQNYKQFLYLHNKIGTIVGPNEINKLLQKQLADNKNIMIGELIAVKKNINYQYCIFINKINDNECKIFNCDNFIVNKNDDSNYKYENVNVNDIYYVVGNLNENYEPGKNYSEIEIYRI